MRTWLMIAEPKISIQVIDRMMQPIAGLSVSAPADRQKLAQWTPLVRSSAARISRALGFSAGSGA